MDPAALPGRGPGDLHLVTFAPEACWKRDQLDGALLLAIVGAALLRVRKASPARRVTGATTMALGLAAVICIGLW